VNVDRLVKEGMTSHERRVENDVDVDARSRDEADQPADTVDW